MIKHGRICPRLLDTVITESKLVTFLSRNSLLGIYSRTCEWQLLVPSHLLVVHEENF